MKKLRNLAVISLTMAGLLLSVTAAKADSLTLVFASQYQSAAPGQTVAFYATVTDVSSGQVFLNADSTSLLSPLTLDDTPFLTNFPLSLKPGDSYTGELITVTVPSGVLAGLYPGSFEILGGSNPNAQNEVALADFGVQVVQVTPEPSSLPLLVSGLATLTVALRRRLMM